jgi:DNA primase
MPVSDSLARSALVAGPQGALPVRESVILVALVNHPPLIDEFFDRIESLEFGHRDLARLHGAILEAVAEGDADEPAAIRAVIARLDLAGCLERAVELLRRTRHWPVLEGAALDDARDAFAQALHLHRASGALHRELRAAEAALADQPTEENYRRLLDIRSQFRDTNATEAMIEGFGTSSGRTGRA